MILGRSNEHGKVCIQRSLNQPNKTVEDRENSGQCSFFAFTITSRTIEHDDRDEVYMRVIAFVVVSLADLW